MLMAERAALIERAQPVLTAIQAAGGSPLIVGGAVRDMLLGLVSGDLDLEVYGLSADELLAALAPLGKLGTVGRSFGVIKLRLADDREFDVAIPSRSTPGAQAERGLLAALDPAMQPREAAARRDFTWNALALTPDGVLLDFFGGVADLAAHTIRHVSAAFAEDPLRVLRAVQLAARFDFALAPETATLCRTLLPLASSLATERVWGEWSKWAAAAFPAAGLRTLDASGWLALYPELLALQGCNQSPQWHPEGDVWLHTSYVCDAAAQIARRELLAKAAVQTLVLAALCHDLGKPATSLVDERGRIRSPGHAEAGIACAQSLFKRIGTPQSVVEQVLPLVREHMAHHEPPTPRTVRRLAWRLAPATIEQWTLLVEADHSGRPPQPPRSPAAPFAALARQLGTADAAPTPILSGRDLLAAGYQAGPELGVLLRQAYTGQLDEAFTSVTGGLDWLAQQAKQHNSSV